MQLTKNFRSGEFLVSSSYPELIKDVVLTSEDIIKVYFLCVYILQPARTFVNELFNLTSGKRSPELNKAIHKGEEKPSLHLYRDFDCAVDFTSVAAGAAYNYIRTQCTFGEIILYLTEKEEPWWVHVSLPNQANYGQELVRFKGDYYTWREWVERGV